MIFWRRPQGRENKTEATAKTFLEWLFCTFSSTFFHEGSPRGTKSGSGPLESSNPSESSDLLILTCTNATARVLNNASIFINETRALKPWNVFTTVMWSLCLSDDLLNLKYMQSTFHQNSWSTSLWTMIDGLGGGCEMLSKPINNLTLINKELPTSTKIWSNLEPLLPKLVEGGKVWHRKFWQLEKHYIRMK